MIWRSFYWCLTHLPSKPHRILSWCETYLPTTPSPSTPLKNKWLDEKWDWLNEIYQQVLPHITMRFHSWHCSFGLEASVLLFVLFFFFIPFILVLSGSLPDSLWVFLFVVVYTCSNMELVFVVVYTCSNTELVFVVVYTCSNTELPVCLHFGIFHYNPFDLKPWGALPTLVWKRDAYVIPKYALCNGSKDES